ncbi:MAG TPA: NifU family protein [Candidatus Acidoferrum sp.]|nr:NifU family protein [Candidatus Acidoferrum sp.]
MHGVDELEGMLAEIDDERALAAISGLLQLYGAALRKIVERLRDRPELVREFAADDAIGPLLLLHDLHPDTLKDRVGAALDSVRPYLGSHGGDVELIGVDGDVVRVRLSGTCNGCAASSVTLKSAIEDAVRATAPEITRVEAEEQPAHTLVVL